MKHLVLFENHDKKCPECGSEMKFLGPGDYHRQENGDYSREMTYQCKNVKCKNIIKEQ